MEVLTKAGYDHINSLNDKYEILQFEITNMEEYEEFRDNFWKICYYSDSISEKDAKYMYNLDIKLGYYDKGDKDL